jgi:hypothetical protein
VLPNEIIEVDLRCAANTAHDMTGLDDNIPGITVRGTLTRVVVVGSILPEGTQGFNTLVFQPT